MVDGGHLLFGLRGVEVWIVRFGGMLFFGVPGRLRPDGPNGLTPGSRRPRQPRNSTKSPLRNGGSHLTGRSTCRVVLLTAWPSW